MVKRKKQLLLGITGATGAFAAELLIEKSPWPVNLVASEWGKRVFDHERGGFDSLAARVEALYADDDLFAPVSSGSVETVGMVILPCSANTLGEIAAGVGGSLITRAAHCHLKERRPLILCLRETPLTLIDFENAAKISAAGGIVMPLAPPFYMFGGHAPESITLSDIMSAFVDRVLALLGHSAEATWEDVR